MILNIRDSWNKLVKIIAVTGVCAAAYLALFILMCFAAIGANEVYETTLEIPMLPLHNSFILMGEAMMLAVYNLAFIYLAVLIGGVWLFTTAYVLREEAVWIGSKMKGWILSYRIVKKGV